MILMFIAAVAAIVFIIMFISKAAKKKAEGSDMGEHGVSR